MGATPATVVVTVEATVADIRHRDFRCRWDTETTVAILDTPVTVDIRDTAAIRLTEVMDTAHGTTQATWITTDLHWFLTVVTSTMSRATMTCIVRATGTIITTDSGRGTRLSARYRQAVFLLSPTTAC